MQVPLKVNTHATVQPRACSVTSWNKIKTTGVEAGGAVQSVP